VSLNLLVSDLATSATSNVLVMKPDVLKPGQIYSLRADIIDGTTVLGSNRVFMFPNRGPTSGRLSLSTTTANKFDRVEVVAESWVDEDISLNYLFSIIVPGYPQEIFLGDATDAASISFLIPVAGPATLVLRVADSNGARTEFQSQVVFGPNTSSAPSLGDYQTRVSWGDVRGASQIATAIILSANATLYTSSIDSIVAPLFTLSQSGQLSPVGVQAVLNTLSVACFKVELVSGSTATMATDILDVVVQIAETQAQRAFSSSTSKLGSVVASSFLSTAAGVARSIAGNQDIGLITRSKLLDVVSRLVSLQARDALVNEQAQNLYGQFLNATSQILSSAQPIPTSAGTVTLTLNIPGGQISIQTITWSAASFPYSPSNGSSFQSNIVTILFDSSSPGSVTVDFDKSSSSVTSDTKCGRLDEQTKKWTTSGCSLSTTGAAYSCTCQLPSSSGTQQRVSLSLLVGATGGDPLNPPSGGSNAGDPAGLSSGAAAAIAIVVIIVVAVAVVVVVWWRRRETFVAARNKMATLFSRQTVKREEPKQEVAQSEVPLSTSSSRWKLASRPSMTNNIVEGDSAP
jgi:hypothetical protein